MKNIVIAFAIPAILEISMSSRIILASSTVAPCDVSVCVVLISTVRKA